MLAGLARRLLLMSAMCGLCAAAPANSTTTAADDKPAQSVQATATAPGASATTPGASASAPPGSTPPSAASADAAAAQTKPNAKPVRIALLLPLRSETFGGAAQAVRSGFQAAYEREPDGIEISILETADGPQSAVLAYTDALPQADILVGPLARADVSALAQSGKVSKPTLALALPDPVGESEVVLPPNMLAIGLSIEEEARQLANWAGIGRKNSKAFVISTHAAWQRRAARAFAGEWQKLGLEVQQIEIAASSGYINAASLVQMKKRVAEEKPTLLFYALDAGQAQQLQLALGKDNLVYGTSQLNPLAAGDWHSADRRPEMNGVRLVDIPWLLQPEHLAVMVYPRQVVAPDQRANPDLERLYALGIDAYRIARELAARRREFEIDGVTGRLTVRFGGGTPRFSRAALPAIYHDGIVVPYTRNGRAN